MGWIGWIVVGFAAGMLAKAVTGVKDLGCIATTIVGIFGALLGGFIFSQAGGYGVSKFNIYSLFVAFIGACILLFLFGVLLRFRGNDSD